MVSKPDLQLFIGLVCLYYHVLLDCRVPFM